MNQIIDTHGHYVFCVDDGAESLDMSMEMIRAAYEQGARHIFCTSHDSASVLFYKRNLKTLQERVKESGMDVTLHPGCEVYCDENGMGQVIESLENGEVLPLGASNYVLMEFAPWVCGEELVSCVSRLRAETDFEPVIAHIERYIWLRDDPDIFQIIREHQLAVQVNAYSLGETGNESIRDFARRLLQEKLVTFIGSDTHGTGYRPVSLASGVRYIHETCDGEYAANVCWRNAERMLVEGK